MKKILILAPLLFIVLLGGAVWWKYGRVPDPFTVAQQMMDRGNLRDAQLELRNAVRTNPRNTAAHFRLGEVDLRLGDPVAAEKELKTARDMGMEARTVNPLLAQSYMAQGRYKDLLRDFPTQGLAPEQSGPLLVLRALALLATGDVPAAADAASEAERAAPQSVDAVMAEARIAVAKNDFSGATDKVNRALQINPRSAEALLLKGQLQNLQGDRVNALASFDAALSLNPNQIPARLERANVLMVSNQDARAKEDVAAVLKLEPNSAMGIFLQGVLATKDDDYKTADAAFTRIGSLLPRFPRGYYFDAIAKYNLGQDEEASDAASHYLAHNPADPDGIKLFVKIELAAQRSAAAIKVLAAAVDSGLADAEMLDLLGRAYSLAGQPEQAEQSLVRAVALAPKDPAILGRLASVRLSLGDATQATGDFQHVLELSPTQAGAGEALVVAAISAGEIDKAAVALEQLRKAEGDSETVGNLTALLKMAQLDLDGARDTLLDVVKRFPDTVQPRINLAKVLLLQDKPAESQKVLGEILARQPANSTALGSLVPLLLANGQGDRAVALFEAAHAAAPRTADVTVGLANLYVRTGAGQKALALLQQGLKDQPASTQLLQALARTQQSLGQGTEARATYGQLVDQAPTDVATRRVLADLLAAAKQTDDAKKLITDGLKLSPGNGPLLQTYVAILLKADGIDAALAGADKLEKDPVNLPEARLLRGDVYMGAGRYADAAGAYTAELKANPSTQLVLRLVGALNANGRADQASQVLRDWLVTYPTDIEAADALASLDIVARRFFDAEAHLQIVLAKRPSDADALNNLAWVYQQRADSRAEPTAEKAYLISPTPQAADTLGWILTTNGKAANAVTLLRQASALLRGDPTVQYHLAVALKATGHSDEAIAVLRPAAQGLIDFDDKAAAQRLMTELASGK